MTSTRFYEFAGRLLISIGVVLGSLLVVRIARESVDDQVAREPHYLMIDITPAFQLPPATALPTLTSTPLPTPTSTPTPLPLPASRLAIPAIGLNISVNEISPELVSLGGRMVYQWAPPAYTAGHYETSGYPGEGRNIVFEGHNNTLGEVFRHLDKLSAGDEIILLTNAGEFHYLVEQKVIIPYEGHEEEADAQLRDLIAPQGYEMVTLISCWPYASYTSRIVITAMPLSGGGGS